MADATSRTSFRLVLAVLPCLVAFGSNAEGTDLDPGFGTAGIATLPSFGTASPFLTDCLLLDPQERIVFGGGLGAFIDSRFFLARFLPDGAPDPSFGDGGA
jgi:hypothetical protein